jgi:hypothetical protein
MWGADLEPLWPCQSLQNDAIDIYRRPFAVATFGMILAAIGGT